MTTACRIVLVLLVLGQRCAVALPLLVATQHNTNSIAVFDTADQTRRPALPADHGPLGVIAHPNGHYAFVTTVDGLDAGCGGNLLIIDTDSNEIVHCVNLGAGSAVNDVVVNPIGQELFALLSERRQVTIVSFDFNDPASAAIKRFIDLPPGDDAPARLAIHPNGKRLYVSVPGANEIQQIAICEPHCGDVTSTYPVGAKPLGLAMAPGGDWLYVASERADQVTAIDTETGEQKVIQLAAGSGPVAVAVHPARPEIYVADKENDTVSLIDVTDLDAPLITTIPVGERPLDVAAHPWGDRLYVAQGGSQRASVIDLASHAISTIALGAAQDRISFVDFTTVNDIISDPAQSLVNPEVDARNNRIVWQDLSVNDSSIWVANLDPDTGAIDPPNGRGQFVDDGLVPLLVAQNGPEWAFGADTTRIVYSDTDGDRDVVAMAYQDDGGRWIAEQLPGGAGRSSPLGSKLEGATSAYISYRGGSPGNRVLAWRDLDYAPDVEHLVGRAASTGFWADGRPAFVYTKRVDTGGESLLQVFTYDVTGAQPEVVTRDAENKYLPTMWWAPEYGEYVVMCMVSNDRLGIYRKPGAAWQRFNTIYLPSHQHYVHSPEPFVFAGKSYVSVVAAQMLGDGGSEIGTPTGDTEIWIASVRPSAPFYRRLSDPTHLATRKDPESYATTSGVVVLYTEQDRDTDVWVLRRAATGLLFTRDRPAPRAP